jgi:hypothetical protein
VVAETASVAPQAIVEKYWAVARDRAQALEGSSMEVEIRASLPKLQKNGRFHALRRISSFGRITYERSTYEGDGTVKKNVILRFLAAEVEAQSSKSPALAVTPNNYNFKYRRDEFLDGRAAHVFAVLPKKKAEGMFKGEIWIDADTYLELKESGSLVKNPSIVIKRVSFIKKYAIRDGVAVPTQLATVTETRGFGQAQMEIDYSNFSLDGAAESDFPFADDGQ